MDTTTLNANSSECWGMAEMDVTPLDRPERLVRKMVFGPDRLHYHEVAAVLAECGVVPDATPADAKAIAYAVTAEMMRQRFGTTAAEMEADRHQWATLFGVSAFEVAMMHARYMRGAYLQRMEGRRAA